MPPKKTTPPNPLDAMKADLEKVKDRLAQDPNDAAALAEAQSLEWAIARTQEDLTKDAAS